jgi:hypothetical protein
MATYYVPDDYADINTALAAASNNDTIIVRDGTWNGTGNTNIDPGGLDPLTIESENGPRYCIIDGEDVEGRRGFVLDNSESNTFIVDGFTVRRCGQTYGSFYGGGFRITSSPLVKNCWIKECNAYRGAGVDIFGGTADAKFENCLIYDNDGVRGGGVALGFCTATFHNCSIIYNSVGYSSAVRGGGVYQDYFSDSTFYNCIIWGNELPGTYDGRQFYMDDSGYLNIVNCCYADGTYDVYGTFASESGSVKTDPLFVAGFEGAYYLSQIAAGQGSDSSCLDAGNNTYAPSDWNTRTTRTDRAVDATTVDIGYHYQHNVIIIVPTDYADMATALSSGISGDIIIVEDGTYTGANNKNLDPGTKNFHIKSRNGPELCIFNMQNSGRWMYMSGRSSAFVVEGLYIRDGNQGGSGGALYLNSSSPIFRHCYFYSSTSGGGGGAIYQRYGSPQIINCCFVSNSTTAGSSGGGAYSNYRGTPTFRNCAFRANSTNYVGGALANWGVVTANAYDSIFWDNTATTSGNEIYVQSGGQVNLDYCCYSNDPGDIAGNVVVTNSITSDPLFVSGSNGAEYLSHIAAGQGSDSPCIDAGSQTVTAAGLQTKTTRTDEYYDEGTVDMGYHFTGIGPPVSVITGAGFGNIGYLGGNIR